MPDPNFFQILESAGSPSVVVSGQFTTAGTSAPTGVVARGIPVANITRTGVGLYNIVLPWGWKSITPLGMPCGGTAGYQTGDATLRGITPASRLVQIAMVTKASPADTDTTGVTVYFSFLLEKKGT